MAQGLWARTSSSAIIWVIWWGRERRFAVWCTVGAHTCMPGFTVGRRLGWSKAAWEDVPFHWELLMKYKIALYRSEEGFSVSAPNLPGCWSQGETEEEALANIADAIRDYLLADIPPEEGAEIREIEVSI